MSNITFKQYVNRSLKHIPANEREWYVQHNAKYRPVVIIHDITVVDRQITIEPHSMINRQPPYKINSNTYIKNVFSGGMYQLHGCHHLLSIDTLPAGLTFSSGFTKDYAKLAKDALLLSQSRIYKRCLIVEDDYVVLHNIDAQTCQLTPSTELAKQFNIERLPIYIAMMYNNVPIEQNHKLIEKYHQWCEL